MGERPITEVYKLACDLGIATGAAPLDGRVWIHDVDEHWKIALNGGKTSTNVEPDGCMAVEVAAYALVVWWHGWCAGEVGPFEGVLVAHPDGANEALLIVAMHAKLALVHELEASYGGTS